MKRTIKYFGTEEELRELLDTEVPFLEEYELTNRFLDNKLVFDASDEDYYEICEKLGENLYSEEDTSLEEVLVEFLKSNNLVLATAESCTGGLIASKIVNVPGASKVFWEGLVTYTNEAKVERLQVKRDTLAQFGAVSKETAEEMATNLISPNIDIGISTTGIAGPDGGSIEKPVGLVYIGVAYREEEIKVERCMFSGDREEIRNCAANYAIYQAYKLLFNRL